MLSATTAKLYYLATGGSSIEAALRDSESLLRQPELRETAIRQRLESVLRHATTCVPFYRRLYRDGFDPLQMRDLSALPIVSRSLMQRAPADFHSAPLPAGASASQTGGSTGTPLTFWHDVAHRRRMRFDLYRAYRWCGHRPGDRMLFLWGSDYDSRAHRTVAGRLLDRFGYNRRWINAFHLGPEEIRSAVALLRDWQPRFLIAYTVSALLLARALRGAGASISSLAAVQVTAEVLTPTCRKELEEAFAAPVFNRYGCREVGNIAHECGAHVGMHVFEDSHILETVDDDGKPVPAGAPGRVLVTNLTNRATPFIRYELGDIGRMRSCDCVCGRSGAVLEVSEGRIGDVVTSPAGKWIHGEFFTHLFYKVEGVRRFRVVQEDPRTLRILIETDESFREATLDFLRRAIRDEADPDFAVRFERVDVIPPSASGKYRFVESKVPVRVTQ